MQLIERPRVPRKKKGDTSPPRNDVPIKVDAEVYRFAKAVAALRSITLAEYVSEILRPIVSKDFDAEHRRGSK